MIISVIVDIFKFHLLLFCINFEITTSKRDSTRSPGLYLTSCYIKIMVILLIAICQSYESPLMKSTRCIYNQKKKKLSGIKKMYDLI
ncbi:hypothetical protein C2G38_1069024 [Gigaspora rosea]|uniref:Uncharacterized protein n=1 Tax=Gigaspora rosea TaxID=44941 RepID=A0A397VRI0_9GLOM|nr:hypothetical protein C2G38_1069024 [Gigaspora rosea]